MMSFEGNENTVKIFFIFYLFTSVSGLQSWYQHLRSYYPTTIKLVVVLVVVVDVVRVVVVVVLANGAADTLDTHTELVHV
jgi:hypothetical protein